MRVNAFRVWFNHALHQGMGAARRAGMAITRKVRSSLGKIEAGTGVGDDESHFGGRGSRAWLQTLEETVERIRKLFDTSSFERLSRFEAKMRQWLGLPPKTRVLPPPAAPPPPKRRSADAPRVAPKIDAEQAARFRAQVQQGLIDANTRGKAAPKEPGPRTSSSDDGDHS